MSARSTGSVWSRSPAASAAAEGFEVGHQSAESHDPVVERADGLAVVAELVAAHHGTIDAANRAEGGAEFTITLPRARESAPEGGVA